MYSEWVYEPWFTFRFASPPEGTLCGICGRAFQENDMAAIFTEEDTYDMAHTACIGSLVKCECCRGIGYHRRPGRPQGWGQAIIAGVSMSGLLGEPGTTRCKACDGRGFNPEGPACGSPGLPPV